MYQFLDCGDLHRGFARVHCGSCKEEYLVAFSCQRRGLCPSCGAKRAAIFAAFLREEVLYAGRQLVDLRRRHPHLGCSTQVASTLFSSNPDGNCYGTPILSVFPSHSLDADGTCTLFGSGDQSGVDPLLGAYGDHGGPTASHLLPPSSPAVDAGDPVNGCLDETASLLTADQLGQARPFDGDGDGVSVCDIGAVETSLLFADGFDNGGTSAWSVTVP